MDVIKVEQNLQVNYFISLWANNVTPRFYAHVLHCAVSCVAEINNAAIYHFLCCRLAHSLSPLYALLCSVLLCSAKWVCSIRAEGNMFGVQHVAVLPLVCFWIREIHVYERLRLVVNEWTCQIDVLPPLLGYSFLANFIPNWRKYFVSCRTKEIEDKYRKSNWNSPLAIRFVHSKEVLAKEETHKNREKKE